MSLLSVRFDKRFRVVSLNLPYEVSHGFVFVRLEPVIKPRLRGKETQDHLRTLSFKRRHCRLHQAVQQFVSAAAAHQCHDRILH